MKLREKAILYANRPLAICPAEDMGLESHGCLVDEDVAIRLNFPIRNLQYVHLNLFSDDRKRKTRTTGTVRVTIQSISQGRAANSFALKARVVRDLFNITGAEALSDPILSKKLADDSLKGKEERRSRDTTTSPITHAAKPVPTMSKADNLLHVIESHSDDRDVSDSEISDVSSCPLCEDYSCSGHSDTEDSEDKVAHVHRVYCVLHGDVTRVRRVRGKNNFLRDIRSRITEEDAEKLKIERELNQETPEETLDKLFPGGAQNARNLLNFWEERASETRVHESDLKLPDRNRLPIETRVIDVDNVLVAQDTYSDGEIHRDGKIHRYATYVSDGIWNYGGAPVIEPPSSSKSEKPCRTWSPSSSSTESDICSRTACYCRTTRGRKLCKTRFLSSCSSESEPEYCSPTTCYCQTPRGKKLCKTRFKNCDKNF